MKKSLFVAFMSALMLFVCVTANAAEKPGAAENPGAETKQAAVEKFVDAFAEGNMDNLWAIMPERLRATLAAQVGSEKEAKEQMKLLMMSNPKVVLLYKGIKRSPNAQKELLESFERKKAFIKIDGRYYIDLAKISD